MQTESGTMWRVIQILVLASLGGEVATQGCVDVYNLTANNHVPGGYHERSAKSPEACREACSANSTCIGFDWSKNQPVCWILSNGLGSLQPYELADHYTRFLVCSDCWFAYSPEKHGTGGQKTDHRDVSSCVSACVTDGTCDEADFFITNATCRHYESPLQLVSGSNVTHYSLVQCDRIDEFEDECQEGTHQCDQTCHNTLASYTCSCGNGYRLLLDGRECEDIDECLSTSGLCDQLCMNTAGSYQCACQEGHHLQPDGKSCSESCRFEVHLSAEDNTASDCPQVNEFTASSGIKECLNHACAHGGNVINYSPSKAHCDVRQCHGDDYKVVSSTGTWDMYVMVDMQMPGTLAKETAIPWWIYLVMAILATISVVATVTAVVFYRRQRAPSEQKISGEENLYVNYSVANASN